MKVTNPTVNQLVEKYKKIALLGRIGGVLDWDLNVNLPPKASSGRADQAALVTELIANEWLDPSFKTLLEKAQQNTPKLNQEEKAIVRNLERASHFYFKVPKEIIIENAKTTSEAFMSWQQAKKENKYQDFLPYLARVIRLAQVIAQHLDYKTNPYDALLDLYEPQMTQAIFQEIAKKLQPKLTELLKKIQSSNNYIEINDLVDGRVNYPTGDQKQFALFVLKKMGYDFEAGRMDISPHPFTTDLDPFDVRITTRYQENDFRYSLMAAMHEAGHALYEQGINEDYANTPLGGGVSLGIHESQSRLWENQIGRNPAFIDFLTPIFQAFFPDQLGKTNSAEVSLLINQVRPSLIRVEADEVTYNLHIIIRFELENELINDKLRPEDLPEAWKVKMKNYLGIIPKTDREGVLQDVHWSYGNFGYFPTYTLGNLYSAQIVSKMRDELKIENLVEKGNLGTILSWLRSNVHQYGSLYWPKELIENISGAKLDPNYFLDYLNQKYSQIYKI